MKLLTIVGTRPEAIKMAPILRALATCDGISARLCVTAQHRQLLDQPLTFFGLKPDIDLDLMQPQQSPGDFFGRAVQALGAVMDRERPDRVVVQGDTVTALAGTMAAFQHRIPVAHVEAGLRTFDAANPWPEEGYRQMIDAVADRLFAPTAAAAANLDQAVGKTVFVTGNSGVDATQYVLGRLACDRKLRQEADAAIPALPTDRPLILATIHRRESFGDPLRRICAALARLAAGCAHIILPVHPNPEVGRTVRAVLANRPGVTLVDPLPLPAMIRLMQRVDLVLTDSGGVQEEAATLGKQALILRTVTDRPESVAAGLARLAGTEMDAIVAMAEAEIVHIRAHPLHEVLANPFGDGRAAERIVGGLLGNAVEPLAASSDAQPAVPIRLVS